MFLSTCKWANLCYRHYLLNAGIFSVTSFRYPKTSTKIAGFSSGSQQKQFCQCWRISDHITLYRYNVSTSVNVDDVVVSFIWYHSKYVLDHRENFIFKLQLHCAPESSQVLVKLIAGPPSQASDLMGPCAWLTDSQVMLMLQAWGDVLRTTALEPANKVMFLFLSHVPLVRFSTTCIYFFRVPGMNLLGF